jgi:hypothetical protein
MTLPRRLALLRATALHGIAKGYYALDRGGGMGSAFVHTIYNKPKAALRSVRKAERHLREVRRALTAWARSWE